VLLLNLYSGIIETAKTKITKRETKKISNFLTQQKFFLNYLLKTTEMVKAVNPLSLQTFHYKRLWKGNAGNIKRKTKCLPNFYKKFT